MKQRQFIIATFGLIVALTGPSPVEAADAGSTSGAKRIHSATRQFESSQRYKLSPEQMDNVHAGWSIYDFDFCLGLCSFPMSINTGPGGCTRDRVTGGCMQI